jgi:hypothetical protein
MQSLLTDVEQAPIRAIQLGILEAATHVDIPLHHEVQEGALEVQGWMFEVEDRVATDVQSNAPSVQQVVVAHVANDFKLIVVLAAPKI